MEKAILKKTKNYNFGKTLYKGQEVFLKRDGDTLSVALKDDSTLWFGVKPKDIEIIS